MKIIIETESLEELRQIAKELSGAAPENGIGRIRRLYGIGKRCRLKDGKSTDTGGFSWVRVLEMGMRVLLRPASGSRLQAAVIDKADLVFQIFPRAALPWCFGTACGSSSAVSFPFPYERQEFFIMAVFTIKGWFDEDRLQPGVLCDLPEVREGPVKKQYYGFRDHLRKV